MLQAKGKAVLQEIEDPIVTEKGIRLYLKREDLLHQQISGNKWRKLRYNLQEAKSQGLNQLLTFGGAYSNHIYATAAAAKEAGLGCIGIIRGEETQPLNPTLAFAKSCGMKLHYVSRSEYRDKSNQEFREKLKERFGEFYLVPEGGSNSLAVKGCAEILDDVSLSLDVICVPVGTGGTMAGLIASTDKRVLGFSALRGDFLKDEVKSLLENSGETDKSNWSINTDFHFGGYAKINQELIDFIQGFKSKQGVLLDPIYTGKMMFGLHNLIEADYFKPGSTIMAIHTGGLQGWDGIKERFGVEV